MGTNIQRILIKEIVPYEFIGSRFSGEEIRKIMENAFNQKKKVILDFSGVDGITQSFGDEVVGIFTRAFGVDFIKENVKVENANGKVKSILNWVGKYSKKIYDFSKEHNTIVTKPDIVFAQKTSSSMLSSG